MDAKRVELMRILGDPEERAAFGEFAASEHSQENFLVWSRIQDFNSAGPAGRAEIAGDILARFIAIGSEYEVNCSVALRKKYRDAVEAGVPLELMASLEEIFVKQMISDTLPRYLKAREKLAKQRPKHEAADDVGLLKRKAKIMGISIPRRTKTDKAILNRLGQVVLNHPIKSGFLYKRGVTRSTWHRRWCVLGKDMLAYFEDEYSAVPKGVIALRDTTAFERDMAGEDGNPEFTFGIRVPSRVFLFQPSSERDKTRWLTALEDRIAVSGGKVVSTSRR